MFNNGLGYTICRLRGSHMPCVMSVTGRHRGVPHGTIRNGITFYRGLTSILTFSRMGLTAMYLRGTHVLRRIQLASFLGYHLYVEESHAADGTMLDSTNPTWDTHNVLNPGFWRSSARPLRITGSMCICHVEPRLSSPHANINRATWPLTNSPTPTHPIITFRQRLPCLCIEMSRRQLISHSPNDIFRLQYTDFIPQAIERARLQCQRCNILVAPALEASTQEANGTNEAACEDIESSNSLAMHLGDTNGKGSPSS
jgi:hypothetical protein